MAYKATIRKTTRYGTDYDENKFEHRQDAVDWLLDRLPLGYSEPRVNGEPLNLGDEEVAKIMPTIRQIGEERSRQIFGGLARHNVAEQEKANG